MRGITRRSLVVALAVALIAAPGAAQADIFGGDDVILSGILAQAIIQVTNLIQMLTNIEMQVQMMQTMLSSLDSRSFSALLSLINDVTYSYNNVVAGISSVGYTLKAVNTDFQTTFPSNLSGVPFANFSGLYSQWQKEILASAQVAARAQAVISDWQQNADAATAILAQSQGAQGEVAQLQSVVQMLGVLHNESNSVVQTLGTTGRVLGNAAAATASERQLSLEKKRRNLTNYTFRGAPVIVPNRMP